MLHYGTQFSRLAIKPNCGYDIDTFGPVGVRFLEKVEPSLLADPMGGFRLGGKDGGCC